MADLWQGLSSVTSAGLADAEAARLRMTASLAATEALQAGMPIVMDQYTR